MVLMSDIYKLQMKNNKIVTRVIQKIKGVNLNAKAQQYEIRYQRKQNNNTSELRIVKKRFPVNEHTKWYTPVWISSKMGAYHLDISRRLQPYKSFNSIFVCVLQ